MGDLGWSMEAWMAHLSVLWFGDFLFRAAGDGVRLFLLFTVVVVYLQFLRFTRRGV